MFLEQAIRLVSQAPENLAYHLITLLALQVVLALALWQWRQARRDMFALRLAITAVVLLLFRLGLAVALTVVPDVAYLLIFPPLERALDLVTALFLVWAVLPYSPRAPHTNDVILIFLLLLTAVGYLIAAQDWPQWLDAGYSYYQMDHIAYWAISTLIVLMGGAVWLAATRPSGWILRGLALAPLIGAHLLNLLGTMPAEIALPSTAVPFWTRLAYLITFPLLAVVAYRHLLGSMLTGTLGSRPIGEQFATLFQLTSHVLDAPNSQQAQNQAVKLVSQVMAAKFVAVALLDADLSGNLRLVSWRPLEADTHGRGQSENWGLKLKDWPAMQLALHQHQAATLRPDGVGARQLFMLYQELGLPAEGAVLLEPMYDAHGRDFGLLLLGTPLHTAEWSADDKALLPYLAQLVARALMLKQGVAPATLPATISNINNEELRTLTAERDLATQRALAMTDYLQHTRQELQQVEAILEGEQRRLLETQEQLELLRHQTTDDRVAAFEEEVAALRESLFQAEEALALASAGEVGLSTDWVMRTITRYSAELEALQTYTSQLELQLRQDHTAVAYRDVWPLTESLRGPLTNIAGYAELLLDESLGQLTAPQQELLQRMLKATTRLEQVLVEAVHTAEEDEPRPSLANLDTAVDVNEVVQTAVMPLMATLQEKQLTLDLTIDPALPPLHMEAENLKRILTLLLHNAALASPDHGRVRLIARPGTLQGLPHHEQEQTGGAASVFNYLHLVVIDSGSGIPPQWRPLVFDAQQRRTLNGTHIPGLGDQSEDLLEAQDLARMYGGRLWVDSHEKSGTAFSLLLPLPEQNNEQI